jgi:hypothetical protein
MDQLSRKVATNDKILENINDRMDSFSSAIKNQHSFNKMIESQIAKLAAAVPPSDKGRILGQPEDLETTNLSIFIMQFTTTRSHQGEDGKIIPCQKRRAI